MLIGLISDTHIPEARSDVWPEAYERLAEADLILHAGDLHSIDVVDALGELAPIYVARGNGDDGSSGRPVVAEDPRLRSAWSLDIAGLKVGLVHDLALPERPPTWTLEKIMEREFGGPQDIVIHGHTHVAEVEHRRGVLLVNPGSALYPRNMETRLGTLAFLRIEEGRVDAWLEQLVDGGSEVVQEQPRYT